MNRFFPSATKYTVDSKGVETPSFSTSKEDLITWYSCANPNSTVDTYYAKPLGDLEPNIMWSCKMRIRQPEALPFMADNVSGFLYGTHFSEADFFRDICLFPLHPSVNLFQVMVLLDLFCQKYIPGPIFRDVRNGVVYGADHTHDPEPIRMYLINVGFTELANELESWIYNLPKYYLLFMITRGCCKPLTTGQIKVSKTPLSPVMKNLFHLIGSDTTLFDQLNEADLPRVLDSPFSAEDLIPKLPEYLPFVTLENGKLKLVKTVNTNDQIVVDDQSISTMLHQCTDNQIMELVGKETIGTLSSFPSRSAWIENLRNIMCYNNK